MVGHRFDARRKRIVASVIPETRLDARDTDESLFSLSLPLSPHSSSLSLSLSLSLRSTREEVVVVDAKAGSTRTSDLCLDPGHQQSVWTSIRGQCGFQSVVSKGGGGEGRVKSIEVV